MIKCKGARSHVTPESRHLTETWRQQSRINHAENADVQTSTAAPRVPPLPRTKNSRGSECRNERGGSGTRPLFSACIFFYRITHAWSRRVRQIGCLYQSCRTEPSEIHPIILRLELGVCGFDMGDAQEQGWGVKTGTNAHFNGNQTKLSHACRTTGDCSETMHGLDVQREAKNTPDSGVHPILTLHGL